jgi:diaminopimelate decarboxylase
VKIGQKKNFLVLDAGMTELIRPMLYQAYQKIENLSRKSEAGSQKSDSKLKYDVVGPICESTDCFQKDVELPESFRGDLFAIRTAGAYGEVMASGYNLRDKVQSVYSE